MITEKGGDRVTLAELGNGETAPEPRASCAGGIEPPRDPGLTQV